jgi:hypothetical protein
MQLSHRILNALDLDTEEFLYNSHVTLYKKNDRSPFGQVVVEQGRYKLTVGFVEEVKGVRHIIE